MSSFEGEITELDVVRRLVELGREGFTGAIRFENDGIIKIIYFKGGDVLSASTNDRTDSVDEILLRAGKVTREHVKQALAKRKETETLGDALLNLGFITRKELTWARRVQVIGVIRSINIWPAGSYQIVADYLPKREEGTLFPLPQIIVELIVTEQDRPRFEQLLDGGGAVYGKGQDFDDTYARLGLNQDADAIVNEVDGARNATEVAAASGKDEFNVYKLLHALELLGVLARTDKAPVSGELFGSAHEDLGFASAGVADAADAWGGSSSSFDLDEPPALDLSALDTTTLDSPVGDVSEFPVSPMPSWDTSASLGGVREAPSWSSNTSDEMPAWDQPGSSPRQTDSGLGAEPAWGFDDAQLEASRRAAMPLTANTEDDPPPMAEVVEKASHANRWVGLLIAAVVLVGLTFGGFAAWSWWEKQNETPVPVVVHRPKHQHPVVTETTNTAVTSTAVSTTATGMTITPLTGTTGTTATISPAPAVASTPKVPPPVSNSVVPVPTTSIKPSTATATSSHPAKTAATTTMAPLAIVTSKPASASAGASTTHIERSSSGSSVITNSSAAAKPAASASDDVMRHRYDAMAQEHATAPAGNYTVQFELVCQTASLTRAVSDGGSNVWFVSTSYRGQPCYRVFWGHYDTHDAAMAGASSIPAGLRAGATPVVVRVPKP